MRKVRKTVIQKEQNGLTVKTVLSDVFSLSTHEISSLKFASDGITVNGIKSRVNVILKEGDVLAVCFPEDRKKEHFQSTLIPEILYQDEDIVIVNKPAGVCAHPAHGHLDDDMGTALQTAAGITTVRAVGRLDKDVSGIMVYAANRPSAARLSGQRKKGILQKEYTAVVQGRTPEEGTLCIRLAKKEGSFRRVKTEDGAETVTRYTRISGSDTWSLLKIRIETGRTHQIRAVFWEEGFPLYGDALYGGDCSVMKRPALHCSEITLRQPFEENEIRIKAGMPADMENLILYLKEGSDSL